MLFKKYGAAKAVGVKNLNQIIKNLVRGIDFSSGCANIIVKGVHP